MIQDHKTNRPLINFAGIGLSLLLGACGGAENNMAIDGSTQSLGTLSLEMGNNIEFNAVPLEDGGYGIEIIEEGMPGTPSVLGSEELSDANPLELYRALASDEAQVPDLLYELFELSSSQETGWFRNKWADVKPDVERYSCGDTWFRNQCDQGSYNNRLTRLNHRGSYYHQKTNDITDYRSRACSQGRSTYQYRVRRKAKSTSNYVDWTRNISPGQYYHYRWVSSSGIYRFRTELNRGSASSSDMLTDVCVNFNTKNDIQALKCFYNGPTSAICSCNHESTTIGYNACMTVLTANCAHVNHGQGICPVDPE